MTSNIKQIDFQNVEELSRALTGRRYTPTRFSLEVSERDACNGIYAAIKAEVSTRGRAVELDAETRLHIEQAAKWLTDPNGKPGLLLFGGVGNGKTTMARAIANLVQYVTHKLLGYDKRKQIRFITAKEICEIRARADRFKDSREAYDSLRRQEMAIVDDLGEEPKELMVYGQPATPVADILSDRYDKQLLTIVTTNLGKESLAAKYGERLYDRFREWLHPVPFCNGSFRN